MAYQKNAAPVISDQTNALRRVAYIHDANVFGGMEVLQLNMLRHLDTDRYQACVVVPGYDDEDRSSPPLFVQQLKTMGVPILKPKNPGNLPVWSHILDTRNLATLLSRAQIDIAHIQTRHPEAARKATVAAWMSGARGVVRTEHLPPSSHMRLFTKLLIQPFDWMTDYIVTDSDADRMEQIQMLGRPPEKVIRSYCGIDTAKFNPQHDVRAAKLRLGFNPDLPLIGAVGRLHEQKGHTYLIDAMANVLGRYPQAQLVLIGDGDLLPDLQAQVARLGIGHAVRFAGFQADYVPYMEAMDIGVMPSLWEGFSLSMQEFMALGKPMVVTDHHSFREAMVPEQHALMAPVRNGQALAEAIVRLLDDPALAARLAKAAATRVRAEFSIQHHMQDLMGLYDRLIVDPRPAVLS